LRKGQEKLKQLSAKRAPNVAGFGSAVTLVSQINPARFLFLTGR